MAKVEHSQGNGIGALGNTNFTFCVKPTLNQERTFFEMHRHLILEQTASADPPAGIVVQSLILILQDLTLCRVVRNPIESQPRVVGGSRLEQLPAELTQSIFDSLHIRLKSHQFDLVRPLSTSLLAFSTNALYRSVRIIDSEALGLFCWALLSKPTLAECVIELRLKRSNRRISDHAPHEHLVERLLDLSLLSLTRMKFLEVENYNFVGRAVLSRSFGMAGGRALEAIKLVDCFDTIEENLITAWNHLRHLPRLSSVILHTDSWRSKSAFFIQPPTGGFQFVTTLEVGLKTWTTSLSIALSRLFPNIRILTLNHLLPTPPDFSPFLNSINPHSILEITLLAAPKIDGRFMSSVQHREGPSLGRFTGLITLKIQDARVFDSDLIESINSLHSLRQLDIGSTCTVTFPLLHRLLVKRKKGALSKLNLGLIMDIGKIGRTCKDGARVQYDRSHTLVLSEAEGWIKPRWGFLTEVEARSLSKLSIENGVDLIGSIRHGLLAEDAFDEEELKLARVMAAIRE